MYTMTFKITPHQRIIISLLLLLIYFLSYEIICLLICIVLLFSVNSLKLEGSTFVCSFSFRSQLWGYLCVSRLCQSWQQTVVIGGMIAIKLWWKMTERFHTSTSFLPWSQQWPGTRIVTFVQLDRAHNAFWHSRQVSALPLVLWGPVKLSEHV
jgi:hypothetical protein